jgi:hypothetical protein
VPEDAWCVSAKTENLSDEYLVAALRQARLDRYAAGVIRPTISAEQIYDVEILVPPTSAQREFSDRAEEFRVVEERGEEASAGVDRLWDAVRKSAFSGQLTVKWREDRTDDASAGMKNQSRAVNGSHPPGGEARS